jgi:hypothetical protein
MDAMEASFAFWASRVNPHAVETKICRGQKLGLVASVKAIFAKAFCQA